MDVTLQRWLFASLLLWAIGVHTSEALAVAGAVSAAVGLLVHAARARASSVKAWAKGWAPVLLFVVWGVFVTALAPEFRFNAGLARHLDWLLLPVAAAAFAHLDADKRRGLAVGALAAMLVGCLAAGLQHFGLWPSAETFESVTWTKTAFTRVYERIPGTDRFMGGGLLFHRLKFANVTAVTVLFALVLGLRSRGASRSLALIAAALGVVSLFLFPHARSASLSLLVAIGAIVVFDRENRRRTLIPAAVLGGLALFALLVQPSFRERLMSATTEAGRGDRSYLLGAGLSAIQKQPLLGTGLGRFRVRDFAAADAPQSIVEHTGKAHNQFVTIAAETGILGLLLFLHLFAWLVWRMRRSEALGLAGVATAVFFVVLSLAHDPLFHAEPSLAFVLAFGLATSATRPAQGP